MNRLFWLAIILIAGGLAWLLIGGESNVPFGISGDQFAGALYLGVLGLVIAATTIGTDIGLRGALKSTVIWGGIFLLMVGGYQYRYELQDIASRLTAGLVPGSPLSVTSADGRLLVALERTRGGHFLARGEVNGAPVTLLVDTGASSTVLTLNDANRAGIDLDTLSFTVPITTANGPATAARAVASEIAVGEIARRDLTVLIASPGMLQQSLLGMNFINTLSGFDMRGDRLTLID
ncbi:MAG: TIGR02281 family clan AA aspartic protease [Rhizobiaceae bacterium]|nr:TIGR02281 family clan AA aspartic protease [Rhizobiaceae bacterium]